MISAIKICDRVHNLSTLDIDYFSIEKIKSKMQETEKYIMLLAQNTKDIYLIDMLRKELIKLSMKLHKKKIEQNLQVQ